MSLPNADGFPAVSGHLSRDLCGQAEHATRLTLAAGPELRQLVVYVPDAATQAAEGAKGIPPYFCAEPVSNITDAFNLAERAETGLIVLAPQGADSTTIRFTAEAVGP